MHKLLRISIFAGIGAIAGAGLGYLGQCAGGT